MANLRSIKDRITSIKNTQKITKAMKMVAAAKVKKAENAVRTSRPFTLELSKIFRYAYKEATKVEHNKVQAKENMENYSELLKKREIKNVGIVIISSNKGLAGAYCANVVRFSTNVIKEFVKQGKNVKVYLVGQKAIPSIKNLQNIVDFEIKKTYTNILDGINTSSAYVLASKLVDDFIAGEIDSIELITTRYKNMMSYKTERWQLLPAITDDDEIKRFYDEDLTKELNVDHKVHKIEPLSEFSPDIGTVLSKIVPMFITNVIYQSFMEAQASELASRMTAMSAATNNATDMISSLTIEYNKARQAKITQELTEVISGADALK